MGDMADEALDRLMDADEDQLRRWRGSSVFRPECPPPDIDDEESEADDEES
jgi:hypothetical protein